MATELSITVGQYSQTGRKEKNQDAIGVSVPPEPLLSTKGIVAVIADGVSSSEAGGEASDYSVKGFLSDYFSTPESWTVKTAGQKILMALNRWLYGQGCHLYGTNKGLVTTLSALVIKSTTAHVFHVGDTRIYRLHDEDEIECLTTDHRVRISPEKEYLSRAMGIELHIEIDYRKIPVNLGDYFIFVVDGIHEFVRDQEIIDIVLANANDLNKASQLITEKAYDNKSHDNLTCQIVRVESLPTQDANAFYQKLTELPFPPELSAGMQLDGYHIIREMHASSRTQLYLAKDAETKQEVVLKTPSLNFEDDPAYIDLFLHEEWIGKRLDHPHVMKVFEHKRHRQCLYYVAEFIQGQNLRGWMDDNPRAPLSEVRHIIEQIAAGLRAFHRMEMIHQDLKPENIMMDQYGTVKLIDFGSTKIAGLEEISSPLQRINLLGTKNYTAPEYLLGYTGSVQADIFSLGVITYEILTGKLPYGEAKIGLAPRKMNYISACHYNPTLPVWVDDALQMAVDPNPEKRYDSLSRFMYDISHPNRAIPLLGRNPVSFWRRTTIVSFVFNLLFLYYLFR
jgi:serine/threonine protein phosphatase PrpC